MNVQLSLMEILGMAVVPYQAVPDVADGLSWTES